MFSATRSLLLCAYSSSRVSDKYDYEVLEIDLRRAVLALEAMERSQGALDDETKFQEDSPSTAARASDKKGSILDLHRRPDHTEN